MKEIKELNPSRDNSKTLQFTLTVKGEFQTTLRNRNRVATTKFLVVKGKMDSTPLLSKNTLVELAMFTVEPQGTLKETNKLRIKKVEQREVNNLEELLNEREVNDLEELLNEYKEVFEGIGCIQDNKTGKEIEVELEMDADAIPVAQKPRHIPYHQQQPFKKIFAIGSRKEDI